MLSKRISAEIDKVRDCVSHPWQQHKLICNRKNWNMLYASLDAIEHSQAAIEYFYALPKFSVHTGGYLYLYGLLQAIFVQQDAVSNLNLSLNNQKIDWEKDFHQIYEIRELRNAAIGHPSGRGGGVSFHCLSFNTINNTTFDIASYRKEKNYEFECKSVDLTNLRATQEDIIVKILHNISSRLTNEFNQHKRQFKEVKLLDLIPNTFNDSLSKVCEGTHIESDNVSDYFNRLEACYIDIKKGIIERHGSIEASVNIRDVITELDYIMSNVKKYIEYKIPYDDEVADNLIESLKTNFQELTEFMQSIDDEFNIEE